MNVFHASIFVVLLATVSLAATDPPNATKVIRNDGGELCLTLATAGLTTPSGLAVTSDASLFYVAGKDSDTIYVFDTTPTLVSSFTGGGLDAPTGIALTSDDSTLYVCSSGTNDVKVFTADGMNFLCDFTGSGLTNPTDIALTSDDSTLYVASRGTNDIKVFDAQGTPLDSFSNPAMDLDPTGITLTSDDTTVYVSSSATNSIETFMSDGIHLNTIVAGTGLPTDVALNSDDDLMYVPSITANRVEIFDGTGAPVLSTPGAGYVNPESQVSLTLEDSVFAVTNLVLFLDQGDFNGDGVVDGQDIRCFLECYLTGASPTCASCNAADLDGDMNIVGDFDDLLLFVCLLLNGGPVFCP